jgi:hypothetical protein
MLRLVVESCSVIYPVSILTRVLSSYSAFPEADRIMGTPYLISFGGSFGSWFPPIVVLKSKHWNRTLMAKT